MPDCIFCKIAEGEIPATKVHEDETCLAFMDIGPLAEGHVLVIPKEHYELLSDMPAAAAGHIGSLLPSLGEAVREAVSAHGWNVLQNNGTVAGQEVGHVHFHLIPRRPGDGLGYRWPAKSADPEELKAVAENIKAELEP